MPAQQDFKYFTIKIKPEFHQEIKEFCVKEGITMRDFAIQCFEYGFALKEKNEKGTDLPLDNNSSGAGKLEKA